MTETMSGQTLRPGLSTIHSLNTTIIIVPEVIVGLTMFLGGTALTVFASDKILGIVHAGIGFLAFPVAYGLWRRHSWAWQTALLLNFASIFYSTASEFIVANGGLLPADAFQDSVIGTMVTIVISLTIIVLLGKKRTRFVRPTDLTGKKG
jgi:hypothetical protein